MCVGENTVGKMHVAELRVIPLNEDEKERENIKNNIFLQR